MASIDEVLKKKISQLLKSEITLSEFKEWLYVTTWGIGSSNSSINRIKAVLAEHSGNFISDNQLMEILKEETSGPSNRTPHGH